MAPGVCVPFPLSPCLGPLLSLLGCPINSHGSRCPGASSSRGGEIACGPPTSFLRAHGKQILYHF